MNTPDYNAISDRLQKSLYDCFWDQPNVRYMAYFPKSETDRYMYWWLAHALDVLVDGYERTGDKSYLEQADILIKGIIAGNGGTLLNNWYDDMEWLALSMLRLWDITKDESLKKRIDFLWTDIKTAWNDNCGGGMAWRKNQLDYKNTPANAPAAILALRLYQHFENPDDLEWGKRIFHWNRDNLMDHETFYVYDGMNREGDMKIDLDWDFSYCQGTMIGAAVELYRIEGNAADLALAENIAKATMTRVAAPNRGIMPYEGKDDCGLFRGIFFRYLSELSETSEDDQFATFIKQNANAIAEQGISALGLVGGKWFIAPKSGETVDLAQHLSGIMVLEMAAKAN